MRKFGYLTLTAAALALLAACATQPATAPMSFFVTSTGSGKGGTLAASPVQMITATVWQLLRAPVTETGART